MGVRFSETKREILGKEYAERTQQLVAEVKNSFNRNNIVPVDTLILEKIIIHNMNRHNYHRMIPERDCDENWSFVLPEDLYQHILNGNINSVEMRLLFEILGEIINLFNLPSEQHSYWSEYTVYERNKVNERGHFLRLHSSFPERIEIIVENLMADDRFDHYTSQLPEMRFDVKEVRYVFRLENENDTVEIVEFENSIP